MNKRIRKKQMKHPLYSNPRACINRESCDEDCDNCEYAAKAFLKKELKKYGYSISGWQLFEIPVSKIFIFECPKKNKEITLCEEEEDFSVHVADWKTHMFIRVSNVKEAMESNYQNNNWEYDRPENTLEHWKKQRRKKRYAV